MLDHIFHVLESLGITSQKRALHIQFSNQYLNSQVFLQRIDGEHRINDGLIAELLCLSTNVMIPLKQFIGCLVAIDQVTDAGKLFRTTGIITQALQGQSDGSLTLYKLTLEDPTALWKKRRNSRVFMNKTAIDVVEILFKEWQQKSPLFASTLVLDLNGLNQEYDVRPFVMQHNETDYDFLTRLLRSEGINWLVDEVELIVTNNLSPIQAQKLRLIDDNSHYQALDRGSIRYHRSSATEQYDSMTSLIAERSLQPTAVHIQRWQADALEQEQGAGSVQSTHQHSNQYNNASLQLEDAWHFSPAWIQDLNGEDGATTSGNSQIEKFNQNLGQYHNLKSKYFTAKTTVRDTQIGYWFALVDHPEIDQHISSDKEFLITGKNFYNQNNLPKELNQQIEQLLEQSRWKSSITKINTEERQGNTLSLQRRSIKTVPEYHPLQHRPAVSPQRAQVVGPSGDEIHVDEWGRIKVRFLFTRQEDHNHDGGAGANHNDTDSAWVDVLTPWAGEGYGARFLPRIDEIVVIDFFDGNIDRPFVVGRIHEAQRYPTKFDNAGQLPDTKKLSGIKSKEYQGEGFNQLRFDDTTGQISAQLQSSHGISQLNLGKLSHPKNQAESEERGEGFELRTDQCGALRAGEGLLITTHSQDQAEGEHLDAQSAKQQFEVNQNNAKALSEVAKNQQTDEIESVEQLKAFASQIEEKIAKFNKALLLLSSPAGIGLSSSDDIHLSADGQINQFAGDSINLSTQRNLVAHVSGKVSLFAAQNGIKQVAAKGKFDMHAQGDGMDLLAKQGIKIISTEDRIEITSPSEIVITAGGSQIKINSSGIFPVTGGKFEVKAGQHLFMGGANAQAEIPLIPTLGQYNIQFELRDKETQDLMPFTSYMLMNDQGHVSYGKTDANGLTQAFVTDKQENYYLHAINDKIKKLDN
ncbi:type VI secretion system tip protein VgrG [Acinetobacter junii]|uniref:type VI secretion system Vgr family protein n=1 Tax=Acinetobacter junii TaxID=40215 RepID=UPI0010AA010D|nr:type VI secretion system Vgr family protein [Acinetobacter junii]MEB8381352.1 type VI secretion system tip protein VgrG [Acinetobacter junii]TID66310.1 type VI secretion system tip protein VgrG [Acinetobacter junii]TIE03760.1 type VI secretion system tip protein VgrG [Acinetobacter junii]